MSHSANQSAVPAGTNPSSTDPHHTGSRPAGILPMPAQMMASSKTGGSGSGGTPAASAAAGPKGAQQNSSAVPAVPTTGGGDNAAQGPTQNESTNMANTKEKTSMCLLNELARFNKLQPKYELINEKGPPHEKIFSVCLTLGTQKYESSGPSIKKAQHGAAAIALEKCGLPQPVPRSQPKKFKHRPANTNTDAMTPTVKLNTLAMKTGKQVHYIPLNPVPQRPYYGGYRGNRYNQGMPSPNQGMPTQGGPPPNQQQQQQQSPAGQQQGQSPPAFHPPGPPQMPPPPLQQQQGQVPPPGITPPQGMPPQGSGAVDQQGGPTALNPNAPPPQHVSQQGGHQYQNQHNRPYFRYPRSFIHYVKVTIGDREFVGEGKTQKGARQNAAYRALNALENEPADKVDIATTTNTAVVEGNGDAQSAGGEEKNIKSDISLIYEAANLHNLNVVFKVIEERGQPHLKIFKLQCVVGEFATEAEGPSKKDAKRRAAEIMLPKLKELPPVAAKVVMQHQMMQRKLWMSDKNKKKKSKSLLKTSPEDPNFGAPGLHPVSRLVQILQAKNEREPEFTVIEERPLMERAGPHMVRRREFTMQVSAASKTATGKGKTKKDAKKQAAENMLKLLGYAPTPDESNGVSGGQPSKSSLKTTPKAGDQEGDRKVTFKEDTKQKKGAKKEEKKDGSQSQGTTGKGGLAPGLLPMMPGMNAQPQIFPSGPAPAGAPKMPGQGLNRAPGAPVSGPNMKVSPKKGSLRDIAQDLLSLGHSPTAEALLKGTVGPHAIPNLSRPTHQLEYLAKVSGVSMKFNDFPKGNKAEYQSVVYISTEPQSAYRGMGATVEAAHDVAAITALRALAGITDGDAVKKGRGQ